MLRIVSQAATLERFVEIYARFCDRDGLYVTTRSPKEVGTRAAFAMTSQSGEALLQGQCEVIEAYRDSDNRHGVAGMKLRFLDLDEASQRVIQHMVTLRLTSPTARAGPPGNARGPVAYADTDRILIASPVEVKASAEELERLAGCQVHEEIGFFTPNAAKPRGAALSSGRLGTTSDAVAGETTSRFGGSPLDESSFDDEPSVVIDRTLRKPATAPSPSPSLARPPVPVLGQSALDPRQQRAGTLPAPPLGPYTPQAAASNPYMPQAASASPGPAARTPDALPPPPLPGTLRKSSPGFAAVVPMANAVSPHLAAPLPPPPETIPVAVPVMPGAAQRPESGRTTMPPVPVSPRPFQALAPPLPGPNMVQQPPASIPGLSTPPRVAVSPVMPFPSMQAGQPVRVGQISPAAIPILPDNHRLPRGKALALGREPGEDYQATEVVPALGRRWGWRLSVFAASLAITIGLGGGYLIWGSASDSPVLDPAGEAMPEDATRTAVASSTGVAPSADRDAMGTPATHTAETTSTTSTAPATESGVCQVRIASVPKGAEIYAGKGKIGVTPLDTRLPCGATVLRFDRRRYQPLSRNVELAADRTNEVTVKLERPQVALQVSSSPSGATVTVGGKLLGETPLKVDIDGYARAEIVVSLPGYQPYRKRITPKPPRLVIQARLRRSR